MAELTIPQAAWLRFTENNQSHRAWMMLVSAVSHGDTDRAEVLLSILSAWGKTRKDPARSVSVTGIAEALRRIKTGGGAALAVNGVDLGKGLNTPLGFSTSKHRRSLRKQ
ncbi:hypothetical protein [uncultured Ruegeria sp.]|uniref:hypothetical protein n=1 Tax=uncultured Ruegeria sp. TaxID=259304 RepID=UPI00260E5871|nr:hypothetical protein [uncultured Ruegeria sp.]